MVGFFAGGVTRTHERNAGEPSFFFWEEPILDREAGQFPCPEKYSSEHGPVQPPGIGVAQRRVVAGEKVQAIRQNVLGAVAEEVGRFLFNDPSLQKMGEVAIEGDLSQADDDADTRKGFDLPGEVGSAVANLLRSGFVAGWRATDDRGDPGVAEFEAIIA